MITKQYSLILYGCGLLLVAGCVTAPPAPPVCPPVPVFSARGGPPPKSAWSLTASAVQEEAFPAAYAADEKMETRWSSPASDPQWLQIDLGETSSVCGVTLHWEAAYAADFSIRLSLDGETWREVYACDDGDGGTDEIYFAPSDARMIQIFCKKRATGWGYSLLEVEIKSWLESPIVRAPSAADASGDALFDGCPLTAWRSTGSPPFCVEVDFREPKTFGGVQIEWGSNAVAEAIMDVSEDGKTWSPVAELKEGTGGYDWLLHAPVTAQYVRLNLKNPLADAPIEIRELRLRGPEESLTPLALYRLAARKAPPGYYPEALRDRQVYWTVFGLPDDRRESLLDEYGNFEPMAGSPSLMPYLFVEGRLISALDADRLTQALADGCYPMPSVAWEEKGLRLDIRAVTAGGCDASVSCVEYRLTNTTKQTHRGMFFLAVRPVQINPPWQFGGLAPIRSMAFLASDFETRVSIDDEDRFMLTPPPDRCGVRTFMRGDVIRELAKGVTPEPIEARNPEGMLSGAARYDFELKPGGSATWTVAAPLFGRAPVETLLRALMADPDDEFAAMWEKSRMFWSERLNSVTLDLPVTGLVESVKAQIGYMLVNRDGLAIQPGSRNYKRSWMRDGSLTISAMLRMGLVEPVRDYLNWYAERVQPDGLVPPILNNDGTINTGFGSNLEYDSQGQFVYAIMEYYRFTRDRGFLGRHFEEIERALRFLADLRDRTLAPDYMADAPGRERFIGILPASISHEGYDPPMHSYWDDFWALKGWWDGWDAARILGRTNEAHWAEEQYSLLRSSLLGSIHAAMDYRRIAYVPGCAEKGDLDATSTAIAFFPCNEWRALPEAALQTTFDLYYADLIARLRPGWTSSFTPYENRSITAFVDLGRKDYAQVLLDFLMDCRRPEAWQQWGEVVMGAVRKSGYIGDMPHTWVGAGWVNAVRALLADEQGDRLVLLAGVPEKWVRDEEGVYVENLPTHFGVLNMRAFAKGSLFKVYLNSILDASGGLVVRWPLRGRPVSVRVDGVKWRDYDDRECRLPVTTKEVIAAWK